jgi:hypothetical protein
MRSNAPGRVGRFPSPRWIAPLTWRNASRARSISLPGLQYSHAAVANARATSGCVALADQRSTASWARAMMASVGKMPVSGDGLVYDALPLEYLQGLLRNCAWKEER